MAAVFSFGISRGRPGSTVRTLVLGPGVHTATALQFSGSGILASILGSPSADMLDVVIYIDFAAPGRWEALLSSAQNGAGRREFSAAAFDVMSPSEYASAMGIGSDQL
jgi:hypothetical protein